MKPKQFREKAIEGGWKNDMFPMLEILTNGKTPYANFEAVLLNPKAWEAVGKVEGWGKEGLCGACNLYLTEEGEEPCPQEGWKHKMLGMIDALIEGKTIEEYLKTL